MIRSIFSVGLMTLLSRLLGFIRDIMQANVIGAGMLGDAFAVAFRIPNHFRAIFAEGAFNVAFVPTFNAVAGERGRLVALEFADRMFSILLVVQLVLLGFALVGMPWVVQVLAPGWAAGDARFDLAVELTRITFPYLAFVSLTVLISGVLNAVRRYAAAAATAVLLNLCMLLAMLYGQAFPTMAHALATGVVVSGLLQFLLVAFDAMHAGVMVHPRLPRFDEHVRRFWRVFLPAVAGSAGFQIALFADTIIASFLPSGLLSAMYFADHVNQLPVGIIGFAVSTVLLSEMSRRIGRGDEAGARRAQLRSIELTVLGALPFIVAFVLLPETITRALFMHGAFTAQDALFSAQALRAYAIGLLAFMTLRSMTVTFNARSDTRTPVIAMFWGVAANVLLKLALIGPLLHVGLAIGTSIGAWVNIGVLYYFARKRGLFALDDEARRTWRRLLLAGVGMTVAMTAFDMLCRVLSPSILDHDRVKLFGFIMVCGLSYGGLILALFGKAYLRKLKAIRKGG